MSKLIKFWHQESWTLGDPWVRCLGQCPIKTYVWCISLSILCIITHPLKSGILWNLFPNRKIDWTPGIPWSDKYEKLNKFLTWLRRCLVPRHTIVFWSYSCEKAVSYTFSVPTGFRSSDISLEHFQWGGGRWHGYLWIIWKSKIGHWCRFGPRKPASICLNTNKSMAFSRMFPSVCQAPIRSPSLDFELK